jgi:hypothetical protein
MLTAPSTGAVVAIEATLDNPFVMAGTFGQQQGGLVVPPSTQIPANSSAPGTADPKDKRVPKIPRACVAALGAQLRMLKAQILELDRMINAWHRPTRRAMRSPPSASARAGAREVSCADFGVAPPTASASRIFIMLTVALPDGERISAS